MREISLAFGPNRSLIGTVTLPPVAGAWSLGLVLFNAGVVHRVGPHRINVKLARRAARLGVPTLRFDLHGLGDSSRPTDTLPYERQVVQDLCEGMDTLERTCGVANFAVLGFCSGGAPSVWAAHADKRVAAIQIYDAFSAPTMVSHLRFFWLRLRRHGLKVSAWAHYLRALGRLATKFKRRLSPRSQDDAHASSAPMPTPMVDPPRETMIRALDQLARRGVYISLLHAGDDFSAVNYPGQARHTFGRTGRRHGVSFHFLESIDHAVTSIAAQNVFLDTVCAELQELVRQDLRLPAGPVRRPATVRRVPAPRPV